jgi:hypothetical protein
VQTRRQWLAATRLGVGWPHLGLAGVPGPTECPERTRGNSAQGRNSATAWDNMALGVALNSALHTWLADGNARAALVRPDFTVMSAGRDVDELCDATPRFNAS